MIQFLRLAVTFFAVISIGTGIFFFLYPKRYWPIAKKRLDFQGIKGARSSRRFKVWVRIASGVQIVIGIGLLLFVVLFLNRLPYRQLI